MKKYKNYIMGAGILILGIIIGNVFSSDSSEKTPEDSDHEYVKDPVTQLWTCSMHPQIKLEEAGNCPICGMELIQLEESTDTPEKISPDEIVLTQEAIQLANIQTFVVSESDAKKEIRLLGRVKPDERRLFSQVTHIPGRIERLYINFTGEKVAKGQKIIRLYSPDLITAQKELFEAIKSKEIYPELYTASLNKLKLWKLSDQQIEAIENSGIVHEQVDIYSDYTGYVMKRNVELGDHVMTGSNLFDIANLSAVWVMFEAYESDIPWIHINDVIEFTIQAIPGKTYKGKITYIDPFVSSNTRVAKVRVELQNPSNKLLPEMYASGIIKANLSNIKNAVMVPKTAVLWTGKRAVVYVKVPHETTISFKYREIILGEDLGDFYIVKNGLDEGEVVATNGVFRIDASAQLLGQKSMMNPNGGKTDFGRSDMDMDGDVKTELSDDEMKNMDKSQKNENDNHSKLGNRINVAMAFRNQLKQVFDQYINLKDAFVNDDTDKAKICATEILKALEMTDMKLLTDYEARIQWTAIRKEVSSSATAIAEAIEIAEQRGHFKHLSSHFIKAIKLFGVNKKVYEQFCPMADDNSGAYWLSVHENIKNPYFGATMLNCGNIESIIE